MDTVNKYVTIFIFDSDDLKITKEVSTGGEPYKNWGNNVFSMALPVPKHRKGLQGVCIEHYYQDEEITRKDSQGRRLYLSNEFSEKTMRHKSEPGVTTSDGRVRDIAKLSILDDKVYHDSDENVALSKSSFADYILNVNDNFDDLSLSAFRPIFEVILQIVAKRTPPVEPQEK